MGSSQAGAATALLLGAPPGEAELAGRMEPFSPSRLAVPLWTFPEAQPLHHKAARRGWESGLTGLRDGILSLGTGSAFSWFFLLLFLLLDLGFASVIPLF